MLPVAVERDSVRIGPHFSVDFQRTLRIPDDGNEYPLPPGLGRFPVCRVEDYADRVPAEWRQHGGVFIPMYQREALWLNFDLPYWRGVAVKVAVGKVNALTGEPWDSTLHADPQDYLVCPDQPWLDGINAGDGFIKQFVAMPLGMGYTVEGQLTGEERFGGIQIMAFEPKPGRFPDKPPEPCGGAQESPACYSLASGDEMGLGAGGRMRQKIYPDEYGLETWDPHSYGRLYVHIVNSAVFREITGRPAPPTPITAREYLSYGLPWFELYDEDRKDLEAAQAFEKVRTVKQKDAEHGFKPQQDDEPVAVPDQQVVKLGPVPVSDGEW